MRESLAAINRALDDTDTVFILNEPKNAWTDCGASCVREGDVFRLRGHAPFDIVFGYGSAGLDAAWSAQLGPTARETLATAVGMLDWDLHSLREERCRPVRNALYGLRLDYGIPSVQLALGPAIDVPVHFHGPFAVAANGCRCLFADPIAWSSGVYLWTVNVAGQERPWYVGRHDAGLANELANISQII